MSAPSRGTAIAGAWRRALACALAGAALLCGPARAQVVGALGLDDVDRYRGTGTGNAGPVLRASAMAELPEGAYAGIAGLWRTRDAGLDRADALLGWSGRLDAWPALAGLSPDWGWDLALHRTHEGGGGAHDFSEAMAGLLLPGGSLRTWFAPHYLGGDLRTLYTEADASHAFDERWHAFAHLGWLHYVAPAGYETRPPDRVDTSLGIGMTLGHWEAHLARDGLAAGHARATLPADDRRPAWILGASAAF